MSISSSRNHACEIFILAGGLSTRMGRDKSGVRLGRRTLLGHARANAGELGYRVRVIRKDVVARCGPLGGIYTGLKRSQAEAVVFLACDMPYVSANFLRGLLQEFGRGRAKAVFAMEGRRAGFPCVMEREEGLRVVWERIESGEFSMQGLARALKARMVKPGGNGGELANINTPAELRRAAEK